jgi:hypothetical protein
MYPQIMGRIIVLLGLGFNFFLSSFALGTFQGFCLESLQKEAAERAKEEFPDFSKLGSTEKEAIFRRLRETQQIVSVQIAEEAPIVGRVVFAGDDNTDFLVVIGEDPNKIKPLDIIVSRPRLPRGREVYLDRILKVRVSPIEIEITGLIQFSLLDENAKLDLLNTLKRTRQIASFTFYGSEAPVIGRVEDMEGSEIAITQENRRNIHQIKDMRILPK